MIPDGQAGGKTRRLDTDEVDQTWHPPVTLVADNKIHHRITRPLNFGADPAHIRAQGIEGNPGKILIDRFVKSMPETFIHRKITDIPGGQIATVRTETHTAGQIKRGVNTKTHVVFQGDGIDQVMDREAGLAVK